MIRRSTSVLDDIICAVSPIPQPVKVCHNPDLGSPKCSFKFCQRRACHTRVTSIRCSYLRVLEQGIAALLLAEVMFTNESAVVIVDRLEHLTSTNYVCACTDVDTLPLLAATWGAGERVQNFYTVPGVEQDELLVKCSNDMFTRRKGYSAKLQKCWEGPYRTLKEINDVIFWICRQSSRVKPKVVHIERLALYEEKYSDMIECKRTDAVTWKQKEEAWRTIELEFNSSCGVFVWSLKTLNANTWNVNSLFGTQPPPALNLTSLLAQANKATLATGTQGQGKWKILEKTCQPVALSCTTAICESPGANLPGMESSSPIHGVHHRINKIQDAHEIGYFIFCLAHVQEIASITSEVLEDPDEPNPRFLPPPRLAEKLILLEVATGSQGTSCLPPAWPKGQPRTLGPTSHTLPTTPMDFKTKMGTQGGKWTPGASEIS
ncbi:hypothetical protein PR048_013457 [Dryococelus australis]|uniref:Regulatory protein zeste n=1 Tax=Dryococelus australis TaxID=614101 RepID=A0ABQ9HSN1_9NEOP|nr:hypothetical protein PR048_013457 [Dryococelus australis]